FHRGASGLGVNPHGDAAAVVQHRDGIVGVNGHPDVVAETHEGFVDAVVHHLYHQVVKPSLIGAADIHPRPAPNGLQALQHLDLFGLIGGVHVVISHGNPPT